MTLLGRLLSYAVDQDLRASRMSLGFERPAEPERDLESAGIIYSI